MSELTPPFKRDEFCQKRTPKQLDEYFEKKYQEILSNDKFKHKARLKKKPYKTFIEELRPLSIFCNNRLANEDSVYCCLSKENAAYDAIIMKNDHRVTVEITWPIDGSEDYKSAKKLNSTGIDTNVWDSTDTKMHEKLLKIAKDAVSKKEQKDYSNEEGSILLIAFDEFLFDYSNPKHKELLENFLENIINRDFNVQETSFLFMQTKETAIIKGNPAV